MSTETVVSRPLTDTTGHYISLRNLRFLLTEVVGLDYLEKLDYFAGYDAEAADMTLDAAKQLSDKYLYPYYREMDKNKAYYEDGRVYVNPAVGEGVRALGEGGWLNATFDAESGGQQMPQVLMSAALLVMYAANANIAAYGFLTSGAANLIRTFGTDELKETYLPKMMTGEWQGTMALTEPQAGSSLSDVATTAEEQPDGTYHVKGQKIYISGGDHDSAENVVHLLLARRKDGPAGTKGVSLFVVPKFRPENGKLVDNHVTTAGIYGKMGQKGYVAAHLMYGEQGPTVAYLAGEEYRGLKQMFQMMNEARIGTGLMAAGTASAAYYASLQYAKERPQGRHPSNKDVNQEQVLIIEHADVRRMLLFQKCVVEASEALLLYCSRLSDIHQAAEGQERDDAHLLLELLTPLAKSYPAEYGNESTSVGMQVLGGAGYTDDFPLEQHFRDIRVNSIYEGTTTIHGLDLLGRKVNLGKGRALQLLMKEMTATIAEAKENDRLSTHAEDLERSLGGVQQVLGKLMGLAQSERPEVFLADATLFLDYVGLHVNAWLWLKQGLAADRLSPTAEGDDEQAFYASKIATMRYFFVYEFTKTSALKRTLMSDERVTLDLDPADLV